MEILKAVLLDAEEILALQKLAYLSEAEIYGDYSIPPLTQSLDDIKSEFKTHVFLKAIEDGRLIGSVRASCENGVCTIYKLMVHPDYQNRGIGRSLLRKLEDIFDDAGRFELFTGHKSGKNLELYQKLGYKIYKTVNLKDGLDMVYLYKEY